MSAIVDTWKQATTVTQGTSEKSTDFAELATARFTILDTFCVGEKHQTVWGYIPQVRNYILEKHAALLGYDVNIAAYHGYEILFMG